MNINEEKEFLFQTMQEITQERRTLTTLYYDLHKRIQDLNRLEEQGLKDLSLVGYADLHNKINQRTAIHNIERQAMSAINTIIQNSVNGVENVKPSPVLEDIPSVAREEVEEKTEEELITQVAAVEKPKVSFEEMDRLKQIDKRDKPIVKEKRERRQSHVTLVESIELLTTLLKGEGPTDIHVLYANFLELLNKTEEEIKFKNFYNNILPRVVKNEPRVVKLGKGLYQWKETE